MKETFENARESLSKREVFCKTGVTSLWLSLYERAEKTNVIPTKAYNLINEFLTLKDNLPPYKQLEYVELIKSNMSTYNCRLLNSDNLLLMLQDLLDAANSTPVHVGSQDFYSRKCWADVVQTDAKKCLELCRSSGSNSPTVESVAMLWQGFSKEIRRSYENWYMVANEPDLTEYGTETLRRLSENQSSILPVIISDIKKLVEGNEKLAVGGLLEAIWFHNWTPLNRMRLLDELVTLYISTEQ